MSTPLRKDKPADLDSLDALKDEGREYRVFWRAMAHGEMAAPPIASGLSYREGFFLWRDRASELVRSDMALIQALHGRGSASKEEALGRMVFLDKTVEAIKAESEAESEGLSNQLDVEQGEPPRSEKRD